MVLVEQFRLTVMQTKNRWVLIRETEFALNQSFFLGVSTKIFVNGPFATGISRRS